MAPARSIACFRPSLFWFSTLGSAWVFVLVILGAFTTSIGAGMAFPDWPLSNGSLNPSGWLSDVAKFAEHSHRLSGTTMGLITLTLAIWMARSEPRPWVRRLGWWALGVVVIQGILGGTRVLLDPVHIPGWSMSVGQLLRIPHGVLAQVFVCLLFAIAASLSRPWIEAPATDFSPLLRKLALFSTSVVLLQLVVAAIMRHSGAGLAIPTFPLTPDGGLIPGHWNARIAIHFLHRTMALVVGISLISLSAAVWRDRASTLGLRLGALLVVGLVFLQITLGAAVIWSYRNPYYTTAHVLVGALTLASTFLITWWLYRPVLERIPVGDPSVAGVDVSSTRPAAFHHA